MTENMPELTRAHYKEIAASANRLDIGDLELWRKLYDYSWMAYTGKVPCSKDHHRRYFGQRHWDYLRNLREFKGVTVPLRVSALGRSFPLPIPARIEVDSENALLKEVREYASTEAPENYTLNDYVAPLLTNFKAGLPPILLWSHSDNSWIENEVGELALATPEAVLKQWLLTERDVRDPGHTPPRKFRDKLVEVACLHPLLVRDRLKELVPERAHLFNNTRFGLLEEEL